MAKVVDRSRTRSGDLYGWGSIALACTSIVVSRGASQRRLGDGHILGGRPVHAEAALCARRDASGR